MKRRRWTGGLLLCVLGLHGLFAPVLRAQETEPGREERAGVGAGYVVGSFVTTMINIPLKVTYCATSIGIAGVLFVGTLGTADEVAVGAIREGCRGPYFITPARMKELVTKPRSGL